MSDTESVVEAPVEQSTDASAPVETTEVKADPIRDESGKYAKQTYQERVDEITRARREAERERDYWRQRATPQAEAPKAPDKPLPANFNDYNEYVEALADYKTEVKATALKKELRAEMEAERQQESRAKSWNDKVASAKAAHADYESVVANSDVTVSDAVKKVLDKTNDGGTLLYHLAKHPDVADRLNRMDEIDVAFEMAGIRSSLSKTVADTPTDVEIEAPPPPRRTQAPPPPKPLSSGRTAQVSLEKTDMDDYMKRRASEGARWAR